MSQPNKKLRIDCAGERVRPQKVHLAILQGDKEALREMGKNGAMKQKRMRAWRKKVAAREEERKEIFHKSYLEQRDREFRERDEEANLHTCPID